MTDKKRTAHIVSHTHWDREWRYTIWRTRRMLVDFIDELIELLEKGAYTSFLLDGQVAPITDYLEMRPEKRERVAKLVSEGKLEIGPWYTLPDEFPVDGEAMVRNLLRGRRIANELGGVLKVGYTPSGWGQTAQLPQIYRGFGMDTAFIGKHVNEERAPDSEFRWIAPDGSELLTSRFGGKGRQNFFFLVHMPIFHAVDYDDDENWQYKWPEAYIAWHRADPEQMEQNFLELLQLEELHRDFVDAKRIENTWKTTDSSLLEDDRLMMDGCDYAFAQKMLPKIIDHVNSADPADDREWVHTSLTAFAEVLNEKIAGKELAKVFGEMRDGPAILTSGNALATRLYIKKANKKAENTLMRYAEPLARVAAMVGAEQDDAFFEMAWRLLIESQPHDSINGVTQDKTARDEMGRLYHVIDLAETMGDRATQDILRRIDLSAWKPEDVLLVVFNPMPYPRSECLEAFLYVPGNLPYFKMWTLDFQDLCILDAEGNVLPSQWEGLEKKGANVHEPHMRAKGYHALRHRLFFDTGEVPALGYKVFQAKKANDIPDSEVPFSNRHRRTGSLLIAPYAMENENLILRMNPNGTFDLTDKRLGRDFTGLNYYEDHGEAGDYWNNVRPRFEQTHNSLGCAARLWVEEEGPVRATLVSEVTMQLPLRCHREKDARSEEHAPFVIRTAVTLALHSEQVDVRVTFENHHEDHTLRACFPTGIAAEESAAGGHFHIDRRPVRPQGPSKHTVWPDMATLPMQQFVDVGDGKVGLALLQDCLTEYEVMDQPDRTLAVTLMRAVKNWIAAERMGDEYSDQKGSQCMGKHELRYALRPHAGDCLEAGIPQAALFFNAPVRPIQTNAHVGTLPGNRYSLLTLDNPRIHFDCLKRSMDGENSVLRIHNPGKKAERARLKGEAAILKAWRLRLDESREEELEIDADGGLSLEVGPYAIRTLELEVRSIIKN